jgi:hypothetical protein
LVSGIRTPTSVDTSRTVKRLLHLVRSLRDDAEVLDRHGSSTTADGLRALANQVEDALLDDLRDFQSGRVVDVNEAARLSGYSVSQLYREIDAGRIPLIPGVGPAQVSTLDLPCRVGRLRGLVGLPERESGEPEGNDDLPPHLRAQHPMAGAR